MLGRTIKNITQCILSQSVKFYCLKNVETISIISMFFFFLLKEERTENGSISWMDFEPGVDDDGKAITCRAENPNMNGVFVETSWRIVVVCEYL